MMTLQVTSMTLLRSLPLQRAHRRLQIVSLAIAGYLLGMPDASDQPILGSQGAGQSLPFVIIIMLVFRGRTIPTRPLPRSCPQLGMVECQDWTIFLVERLPSSC